MDSLYVYGKFSRRNLRISPSSLFNNFSVLRYHQCALLPLLVYAEYPEHLRNFLLCMKSSVRHFEKMNNSTLTPQTDSQVKNYCVSSSNREFFLVKIYGTSKRILTLFLEAYRIKISYQNFVKHLPQIFRKFSAQKSYVHDI